MKLKIIFFLIVFLASVAAQADVGQLFGFGSRNSSLVGATVAENRGNKAFAAYSNPAHLSSSTSHKIEVGYGLLFMHPNFLPIDNVVTQNSYSSDLASPTTQKGKVDNDYLDTFGQVLGLSVPISPTWHSLTLGFSLFTPLERITYLDTGEPFIPEYSLYRGRTQRPQIHFALGGKVTDCFSLGIGMHQSFSVVTKVSAFLATSSSKASTMRVSSSLKPKIAPYIGGLLDLDSFSLGSVFRFPLAARQTVISETKGELFSGAGSPDVSFTGQSTFLYDPKTIELGLHQAWTTDHQSFFQVDYEFWQEFEPSPISIQGGSTGIQVQPSKNPSYRYKNIFVPRLGHEWLVHQTTLGQTALRAGYSYRPSILEEVVQGSGNLLDPPQHVISLGLGIPVPNLIGDGRWQVDLHASYHYLIKQTVTKNPGTELSGGTGDQKIGAPGYTAGGNIWGGGLTLLVEM